MDAPATVDPERTLGAAGSTVGSLISSKPVVVEPTMSIAEVARAMSQERASAAVVTTSDGHGIVTDADLRAKVLAAGLDPAAPVGDVMTAPVTTVDHDVLAAEALYRMVHGGFHHLPVLTTSGQVMGVVTETDVIGFGVDSPFAIRSAIERAADVATAVEAARRLPGSAAALVDGGVDAIHVGHVVGATVDVLTSRLLDLAFERHGPPPVPWAWLAFGSLGRLEQALHTDQDHGLAFEAAEGEEHAPRSYFEEIATFVTQGLEDAGMPRCRGNIMATNPRLRLSVREWVDAFGRWIRGEEDLVAGATSIVFDFRRVSGPLEVEPVLDRVVSASGKERAFLHRLALHALQNKPPTGRVRDFVVEGSGEHEGMLDLKHGGIVPITDIARLHMVEVGASAHRTLDRLRIASEAGRIDEDTRRAFEESFRLLWHLRLDHQIACVRAGKPPDDFIDPRRLPPVTRQGLREALRVVVREQRALRTGAIWTVV